MKFHLLIEMTVKFIPPASAIESSCGSLPLPLNKVLGKWQRNSLCTQSQGVDLNILIMGVHYGT